jgi:sirohydrochlorin ferrochelatase
MKIGVVILGHGSRASIDEANQVLITLVERLKEKVSLEQVNIDFLAPAFMNPESQRPNLKQAVVEMVLVGAEKIIIAPVFLSNGIHIQKDIPAEIIRLKEKYRVEIKMAPHLGADPRISDIIMERIKEVI